MHRLACVEAPALPLQLLLRQHPEWRGLPVAVVDQDKPQGLILLADARARGLGVRAGLRYGQALALAPELRAAPVSPETVATGARALFEQLHDASPDVEPARTPGVYWLDAHGFGHLHPTAEAWALALRHQMEAAGYVVGVAVGFRRFGTYAAARARFGRDVVVFESPEAEAEATRDVPLALLELPSAVLDALARLGVHRVGELLALPAHGLARRFGPEAFELFRFASGDRELPLSPVPLEPPLQARLELDYGEADAERLVFLIKSLVDRLLAELSRARRALAELELSLSLESASDRLEHLRPAEPTLSSVTVIELVRLRLDGEPPAAPVLAVVATAHSVPATAEQLDMFDTPPQRDPAAAARAFARLRSAFGREDVVVRAALRDRHTPEGQFAFEPLYRLAAPRPLAARPQLVRRLFQPAEPMPGPPPGRLSGPYRLAGGWWAGGLTRDYYFAETPLGAVLWVYYDARRRGWFLQGEVG